VTRRPTDSHPSSLVTAGCHGACGASCDGGPPRPEDLFHVKRPGYRVAENEPVARHPCRRETRWLRGTHGSEHHLDGGPDEPAPQFHVKRGTHCLDGHALATGTTTARASSLAPAVTHARTRTRTRPAPAPLDRDRTQAHSGTPRHTVPPRDTLELIGTQSTYADAAFHVKRCAMRPTARRDPAPAQPGSGSGPASTRSRWRWSPCAPPSSP
jgi:hypothetical protein